MNNIEKILGRIWRSLFLLIELHMSKNGERTWLERAFSALYGSQNGVWLSCGFLADLSASSYSRGSDSFLIGPIL